MALRILSCCAALALAGCSSTAPAPLAVETVERVGESSSTPDDQEPFATIGDTLLITDTRSPADLTLSKKIDIDGTILLPELGSVAVAGRTRSELEALLTEKYSPYFTQLDIHVEVVDTGCRRYFIYGEVAAPGEKPITGDLTIFEAVMSAGPGKATANLGRVRLIRADPRDPAVFEVDLGDLLERGDSSFNMGVAERDIIFVPPTLRAQLGHILERLRAWIREWLLDRPILIVGNPGR